ncbi:MAG: response regulator [Herpetosiphonaceae bacterium]|nr:response regulator [Herpetosiphonaceae bacterium]
MTPSQAPTSRDALVLVVDDDDALRSIVKRALEGVQVAVVTSKGAVEALDVIATRPIKVVLTDITMPDMDGWQLCSLVHARYPELILGIMTGWGGSEPLRLVAHGVSFVVPKPFNVHELQAQVLALLKPTEPLVS